MQYKTGTVTVTSGSATVTGSGTQWLNEIQAGHVFVRAQLVSGKRVDDPVVYTVAGVQSNTQLTLTAPYSGTSGSGQLYGITRDLTPMGKPLLAPSSIGTVPIFNEAVLKLEQQSNQIEDGLGTAATRNVATTAQAIAGTAGVLPDAAGVKAFVSQYGVGVTSAPVISDANLAVISGFYQGFGSGAVNFAGTQGQFGTLIVTRRGTIVQQINIFSNSMMAFRSSNDAGSTWNDWSLIYHTGNIVGTVSQSGGVPTGAIIQRGSNANGEFVRYADGTQICIINDFSLDYLNENTFQKSTTFPASFANTIYADAYAIFATNSSTILYNASLGRITSRAPTSGVINLYFSNAAVNSSMTCSVNITIHGRWY